LKKERGPVKVKEEKAGPTTGEDQSATTFGSVRVRGNIAGTLKHIERNCG